MRRSRCATLLAIAPFLLPTEAAAQAAADPCGPPFDGQIIEVSPRDFGQGHTVTIRLSPGGLQRLEARARCRKVAMGLFLDGWLLKGAAREPDVRIADALRFVLQPSDDDRLAWKHLLKEGHGTGSRLVPVQVGLADGSEVAPEADPHQGLRLRLFPRGKAATSAVLFVAILVGTLAAAAWTTLLRDAGQRPAASRKDRRGLGTFSFARVQMLWWTLLAVFALLFVWAVTGVFHPPSGSLLTLMGISAGTYLLAAVVDNSKAAAAAPAGTGGGPPSPTPAPQVDASEGFFNDILTDRNGYSLHRVQMLIWTVVSSAVFLGGIFNTLAIPEIDATMLGLMGLSNGTYVGFKFPEKPA